MPYPPNPPRDVVTEPFQNLHHRVHDEPAITYLKKERLHHCLVKTALDLTVAPDFTRTPNTTPQ